MARAPLPSWIVPIFCITLLIYFLCKSHPSCILLIVMQLYDKDFNTNETFSLIKCQLVTKQFKQCDPCTFLKPYFKAGAIRIALPPGLALTCSATGTSYPRHGTTSWLLALSVKNCNDNYGLDLYSTLLGNQNTLHWIQLFIQDAFILVVELHV